MAPDQETAIQKWRDGATDALDTAENMKKLVQQIARQFSRELKQKNIPFDQVYIFGSAARGTQHEWSDIDVGIVGPAFGQDRIEEAVILRQLAYKIDASLTPIPLRPEDIENRFSTIGSAIRREGIRVTT